MIRNVDSVTVVTVDNFCRAETDRYFAQYAAQGRFGRMGHSRAGLDVTNQVVIRMNRDTWYSSGIFDLTAPVTVTVPETQGRFISLLVINQDHYVKRVEHDPGTWTLTEDAVGSRYAAVIFRILVNPDDPEDVAEVHRIQDAIHISQDNPGELHVPNWDQSSLDGCRAALLQLAKYAPAGPGRFGDVGEVDPIRHLISTAAGWGGNPPRAAMYFGAYPTLNDGTVPHTLTLSDVPADGFWSVSVYNAEGYFQPNPQNAYSLNSSTAVRDLDGGVTVRFGGDPAAPNYLAIMPGWNYVLRLYRPRSSVLTGVWTAPEAVATPL